MIEKTIDLIYYLSPTGQKASLLSGGSGAKEQIVTVPLTEELLNWTTINADGTIQPIKCVQRTYKPNYDYTAIITDSLRSTPPLFDAPQTADYLIAWLRQEMAARVERRTELETQLPQLRAEYEQEQAQYEQQRAEENAKHEAHLAAIRAKHEEQAADKKAWIAAHGSAYLKHAALDHGYPCQERYVVERAALELPDYRVDLHGSLYWDEPDCPSADALAEVDRLTAQGYTAQVVWLTRSPNEDDDAFFTEREAVIVRRFLGRYDLVRASDLD